ncbi:O-methyltransferase [Limnobacter litoralis]|uniref:Class I SAM-dependent methyltransferase n=1 Tax=Limnobacter litoralis TaxID=481366 RepID=A0ABQ5YNM2_9BURK|nr:class I SAM-dependent methyltransferase [Limnobacter litoralis]GLR26169.1 hypothetical protein GCM10007875_12570 [Limnobacter litoralis]
MNTATEQTAIRSIRPKVLFQLIESRFPDQNVGFKVNIPSPDIGGMTLLESSVLVSLARLIDARSLFEFGTFMGATTLLLAENTPPDAQVVTLDLPDLSSSQLESDQSSVLTDGHANDAFLTRRFAAQGARCIRRAQASVQSKVQQVLEDSMKLDVVARGYENQFDFVFVDGGHAFSIVQQDTRNAYRMIKADAVVVWHDYRSTIHNEVTTFLDGHAVGRRIFHVANTMIAFELFGRFESLLDSFL